MIVLDAEIKKAIPSRKEPNIEGIEYCDGWRDFGNMGIACVCTFDITTNLSRVFFEQDLLELGEYLKGKPTAGFNTRRFDLQLLAAHGVKVEGLHYDMLEAVWLRLGLDPDRFYWKTHGGWSLDAICEATLGVKKSGDGAGAPVWWQQGKVSRVVDYCLRDVWLEAQLLRHVVAHRFVQRLSRDFTSGLDVERLELSAPIDVREACATAV